MIWRATGPIHDRSSAESGFESAALQPRSRDLTTGHRGLKENIIVTKGRSIFSQKAPLDLSTTQQLCRGRVDRIILTIVYLKEEQWKSDSGTHEREKSNAVHSFLAEESNSRDKKSLSSHAFYPKM
ncbi:hypothetical protein AVEN_96266-1 [Araneus ventricosus]|uniref:Uncharacterized protein n=1 Tax=Araneus ventricosus TaxID=182803 RepID=A0A4Y2H302_ARAVE|nr:hypothetical protein AVEN_96266-1 [Araneus ventricosus]